MSILKDIKTWLTDLLCISNYDRKVERKFWKMRHCSWVARWRAGAEVFPTSTNCAIYRSAPLKSTLEYC